MRRALAKFLFIILLPLKFIRSGKVAMEHNFVVYCGDTIPWKLTKKSIKNKVENIKR